VGVLPCPWNFWDDRCYRTVKRFAPDIKMNFSGVKHHALADARHQALHLQRILIEKGLNP
jgi:exodeoxyribonuclease VIII